MRGLVRSGKKCLIDDCCTVDFSSSSDFSPAVHGVDTVIHCAARVHVMHEATMDSLVEFRRVNVEATLKLARHAVASGVRRFIFVSTVKVNGESSSIGVPFNEKHPSKPSDAYAMSKCEAEKELFDISRSTSMEVVIIRPPLIYGPGVKGNFLSLLKMARSGMPLPFGAVQNVRSMIYLGNLVDFVIRCIDHPAAANELFMVSDMSDVSLAKLLKIIRMEMGMSPRLLALPPSFLYFIGHVARKTAVVERLLGTLQVDSSKANRLLGWNPPYSLSEGLSLMVSDFAGGK